MKRWSIGCLLALFLVSPALAGEDPFLAIVGNDINANPFYFSPKYLQFAFDQTEFDIPVCSGTFPTAFRNFAAGCEQFRSQGPVNQPEICDASGVVNGPGDFTFRGEPNARVTARNTGFFEWFIRLPKKPSTSLNICIQCGVLKPNSFALAGFNAVEACAAETGERVSAGCSRQGVGAGTSPIINSALPTLTVKAFPGPFAGGTFTPGGAFVPFTPFNLTAFRNPGSYDWLSLTGDATQVLDGSVSSRILLKSCFDKCVVVKLPVGGEMNDLGQAEQDLEAGDLIDVRLNIPRAGTTDIFCNAQSARILGIGEAPF